jgi:hypothetical protein
VTGTGSRTYESKAEEKKEGQVERASSKQEYADLEVTSLKMSARPAASKPRFLGAGRSELSANQPAANFFSHATYQLFSATKAITGFRLLTPLKFSCTVLSSVGQHGEPN